MRPERTLKAPACACIGHPDGPCETCLEYLAGAFAERKAITAWLREQGGGSVLQERRRYYARSFAESIDIGAQHG